MGIRNVWVAFRRTCFFFYLWLNLQYQWFSYHIITPACLPVIVKWHPGKCPKCCAQLRARSLLYAWNNNVPSRTINRTMIWHHRGGINYFYFIFLVYRFKVSTEHDFKMACITWVESLDLGRTVVGDFSFISQFPKLIFLFIDFPWFYLFSICNFFSPFLWFTSIFHF